VCTWNKRTYSQRSALSKSHLASREEKNIFCQGTKRNSRTWHYTYFSLISLSLYILRMVFFSYEHLCVIYQNVNVILTVDSIDLWRYQGTYFFFLIFIAIFFSCVCFLLNVHLVKLIFIFIYLPLLSNFPFNNFFLSTLSMFINLHHQQKIFLRASSRFICCLISSPLFLWLLLLCNDNKNNNSINFMYILKKRLNVMMKK